MKRMLWAVPVILAAAVLGGEAQAQSSTTPQELDVSITITNSCTVSIASPISFGSQGSLATAVTATGTIDVNCTTDHPYDIALDAGEGTGATVEARLMTGERAGSGGVSRFTRPDTDPAACGATPERARYRVQARPQAPATARPDDKSAGGYAATARCVSRTRPPG